MSWTSVGSLNPNSASSGFSLTPSAVGNLLCLWVQQYSNGTVYATACSSSNVTWTAVGHVLNTSGQTATMFVGTVTSASAATVTITWSGTAPANQIIDGHEFHSSVGTFSVDNFATLNNSSGTNTWPSIAAAGSGELYAGAALDNGAATVGSSSGYTYTTDSSNNGVAWNLNCSSGTVSGPVWGDSGHATGVMALITESSGGNPYSGTNGELGTPAIPGKAQPGNSIPGQVNASNSLSVTAGLATGTGAAKVPAVGLTSLVATGAGSPSGGASVVFGDNSSAGLTAGGLTEIVGTSYSATASGTVSGVWVYCEAAGSVQVAIYSDSAGSPNSLLSEASNAGATASGAGFLFVPMSTTVTVTSGTSYWLTAMCSNGSMRGFKAGATNQAAFNLSTTYGAAFPSTFPTPSFQNNDYVAYAMIVTSQPAGIGLTPPVATGTGAAKTPSGSFSGNAGLATGGGIAQIPGQGLTVGLPNGAGAAQAVGGGLTTGIATGQGQVPFTGTGITPGLASGTGAAQTTGSSLGIGLATATGTAQPVTSSSGGNVTAGLATGTGTAQAPTPAISVNAGLATATGTAQTPGESLGISLASATGAAQTPAHGQAPGLPSGTGAAQSVGGGLTSGLSSGQGQVPFAGTGLGSGLATGSGGAFTVASGLTPGLPSGTATVPAVTLGFTPGTATGNGIAGPVTYPNGQVNVDFTGSTLTDANTLGGTVTVVDTLTGTCTPAVNTLSGTCTPQDTLTGTLTLFAPGGTLSVTSDTLTGTLSVAANTLSAPEVTDKMQEVDIVLNEFNDATVTFQIKNNGSPMDITGYTVNALFKKTRGDLDSAGTTKTYSSGGGTPKITIVTPTTGSCSLAIPEADMVAPVWTFYRIDIVSVGGVQTTAIFGTVTITSL